MTTTQDVQAAVAELATQVRGPVIRLEQPGYEAARRVYNALIDRHPAAVVRAATVGDVMATVRFAAEQGQALAVRGGSHNIAGFSTCDSGLVLDLGSMTGIRVDPRRRRRGSNRE